MRREENASQVVLKSEKHDLEKNASRVVLKSEEHDLEKNAGRVAWKSEEYDFFFLLASVQTSNIWKSDDCLC